MIDPLIIAGSAAAGLSTATFVLRDVFARAAIKRACLEATADIENFKKDNVYVTPLDEEQTALATVMRTTIGTSREMKDSVIAKLKEMRIPNPQVPLDLPELEKAMIANNKQFLSIMKKTYGTKITNLYAEQVNYRFQLAKEAAAKKAAHTATGAAATASAAADATTQSDTVGDTYEAISKHVQPHLAGFEKDIVDFLDELGVIDAAVNASMKVNDFISAHFSHATVQTVGHGAEILSSLYHFPGSGSGMISIGREFDMLMKNETSLGDAFKSSGLPIFIRSVGIKIGMVLDAATFGASFGSFTFLGSYLSKFFGDKFLEEQNRKLLLELEKLTKEIKACHRQVLRTINAAVRDFEEEFARRVEKCPDINEEKILKGFMGQLKDKYNQGFKAAEDTLAQNTEDAIAKIPENTWLDRLLFIDRRTAVKKMFLEAQRNITSRHAGLVHNFHLATESHAEDGINFMIRNVVFDTPEMTAALKKLEAVTKKCAENYAAALSAWETQTITFRKEGNEQVASIAHENIEDYKDFVAERKPTMNSIARKIQANNRRMGRSPKPAAA